MPKPLISRPWAESLLIHAAALGVLAFGLAHSIVFGPARHAAISGVSLQARGSSEERKRSIPAQRSSPPVVTAKAAASVAQATEVAEAPGSTQALGGSAYDSYLGRVRDQIDRSIVYPMTFRARRISGLVTVHMNLDPRGEIRQAEIAASSGSSELDHFVLEAVHSAGPFPPFAASADANSRARAQTLSFNLPIELKMR